MLRRVVCSDAGRLLARQAAGYRRCGRDILQHQLVHTTGSGARGNYTVHRASLPRDATTYCLLCDHEVTPGLPVPVTHQKPQRHQAWAAVVPLSSVPSTCDSPKYETLDRQRETSLYPVVICSGLGPHVLSSWEDYLTTPPPACLWQGVHAPYSDTPEWERISRNNTFWDPVFGDMLSVVSSGIGNVTQTLKDEGMWDDALSVISSSVFQGGPSAISMHARLMCRGHYLHRVRL